MSEPVGEPQAPADPIGAITKIAAECHRAKWQFDFNDENRLLTSHARDMIKRAFGELHRIGNLAIKCRDELRAAPLPRLSDETPSKPVDLTNHHNALKCPYCNPQGLQFAVPVASSSDGGAGVRERLEEFARVCDLRGGSWSQVSKDIRVALALLQTESKS